MASSLHLRTRTNLLFASGPASLTAELTLEAGTLTGLYGSSGSGKTTLLRIMAGLTTPEWGQLTVDNQVWLDTDRRINVPAQQRSIGMVFQDTALFPNMTVRENVSFAANRQDAVVNELLELVGLQNLAGRKPATLSGGQRQRVALIRALARRPRLLLLDEPFSALDSPTRTQLLTELVRLHQQFGTTTILVSHHQAEMERTVGRLIWLEQGQVQYTGPVRSRSGDVPPLNTLTGTVADIRTQLDQTQLLIRMDTQSIWATVPPGGWQIGERVRVSTDGAWVVARE